METPASRPKLFISHASEDQEAFVRPLVEALTPYFQPWYAPHALVPGKSLREQIESGLRESDYGLVVLSESFFSDKRWPILELDALMALEEKYHKIVIP